MYVGILGGSFNPVHVGHIRLALEALECSLTPMPLDRVDLVPCAQPPHKPLRGILPFSLRLSMLRATVRHMPQLTVNDLEGQRQGPSFTWDTLHAYGRMASPARLLFLVGGEDFAALPQWHKGLELPLLADIGMVPRAGSEEDMFCREVARNWPQAALCQVGGHPQAVLPSGHRLMYLPLPRLDISASYIRQRWLKGGNVRFLMPEAALHTLEEHKTTVIDCWNQDEVR